MASEDDQADEFASATSKREYNMKHWKDVGYDYDHDDAYDYDTSEEADSIAPLILITDHPDFPKGGFASADNLQWHVHHRRGSIEAKLKDRRSSSPTEKYGERSNSIEEIIGDDFTLVDFDVPTRSKPVSHPGVDCPLCDRCRELELSFFDPTCRGCSEILQNPKTTISHIFAIMRQWTPQVQQNIDVFVQEILRRGGHLNDRDGLTDMTMLHYASKSGAGGVGDPVVASETVHALIEKGADFGQKCRWTDMLPIHYATFFDIVPVITILLNASGGSDADSPCKEFDNGTPLHIACSNLCLKAAKCLLAHKANPNFRNGVGKKPRQCLPPASSIDQSSEAYSIFLKMQALLLDAEDSTKSAKKEKLNDATLHALGLTIGDNVIVSGKRGVLLYCGPTEFASGHWAGIALNEPTGKNDGSVGGIRYFQCEPKCGIFAPISRVAKANKHEKHTDSSKSPDGPSSLETEVLKRQSAKFQMGERVLVAGQKKGQVQFIGEAKFATGVWVGVELDEPSGKNDGSVAGVRYFRCEMNYGIFAPVSKVDRLPMDSEKEDASKMQELIKTSPESNGLKRTSTHDSNGKFKNTQQAQTVDNLKSEIKTEKQFGSPVQATHSSTSSLRHDGSSRKEKESTGSNGRDRVEEMGRSSMATSFKLKIGMSVYVNNELGIVRFIGHVEFADGVWLGVELRRPSGKNDGAVGDKRYFTCKPKHGLLIRPSRATCRGINCAQLLPAL